MATERLDRIVGRISEESRLARTARHPRARIAHYMLADAYRVLVNRMLSDEPAEVPATAPLLPARIKRGRDLYDGDQQRGASTGFLADRNA